MLSSKYHIAYWAAAASVATVYQLLVLYYPFTKAILQAVLAPLALFTLISSWAWQHGPKKTDSTLYMHQAAVAHLLVAIGSVAGYYHAPQSQKSGPNNTAVTHTLLAFVVLGTLESIRQDRRDIEPGSLFQALRGPRSQLARFRFTTHHVVGYWTALVVFDVLLFGILKLADGALDKTCGMSLQDLLPFYKQSQLDVQGRFGSAMVSIYLGGPFADLAKTVFYVLCRNVIPGWQGWMPPEGPLLKKEDLFALLDTEQCLASFFWVPYVTLSYWLG